MKGYIYKLTCTITGKVYIGKTIDINRRMAQHSKITSKYSHHLANAIKKYGIDNFKEEIIFEVEAEDRAVLNTTPSNAEKSYIEQYDSYRNGYNSITDAAKNIDKDTSHIVSCCKGRRKTAYGFIWKYEEKEVIHG